MSTSENKDLIYRYIEALSGKPKPESLVSQFVAEQSLKDHVTVAEAAFPNYRVDTEEIIAEGDLVSFRGWVRGVHKGPFMGILPTGKEIDISMFITYRIAGGKIVDHWMLIDTLELMRQLGVSHIAQ